MNIKTYDDVTVKKEKDSVVLTNPERCFPMKRSTWRAIVADNVKEVMRGNSKPQHDNPWYDEGSITTPADITVTGPIYPDTRHGDLR